MGIAEAFILILFIPAMVVASLTMLLKRTRPVSRQARGFPVVQREELSPDPDNEDAAREA